MSNTPTQVHGGKFRHDDELARRLVGFRRSHPAWLLLASPRGPLILGALKSLIEAHPGGVDLEVAVEHLSASMMRHFDDPDFEIGDQPERVARRELRGWIKRKLIVERDGQLLATDALQRCFQFIESLEDQTMTSTASRLATVQRAIESLSAGLSGDQEERAVLLEQRIAKLQDELDNVRQGNFEVLTGSRAAEEIREVYQLAISLRNDFRRVEDSFRLADRRLRETILSNARNRGEIVDELLDGHESLLETAEGQVFDGFYQQLVQSADLDLMKSRLRQILVNPSSDDALDTKQKSDLRRLVRHLLDESQRVIQARAQSERDVRGFLKSGFADEHFRIGELVQEIMRVALAVDWQSQSVCRTPSTLPPIAVDVSYLPLISRLRVKQFDQADSEELNLEVTTADSDGLDEEFWSAYHSLDRQRLFEETLAELKAAGRPMTIGELAAVLPPTHDLETLSYWLTMAREAGIELQDEEESIDLTDEAQTTRFFVPWLQLSEDAIAELEPDRLE